MTSNLHDIRSMGGRVSPRAASEMNAHKTRVERLPRITPPPAYNR